MKINKNVIVAVLVLLVGLNIYQMLNPKVVVLDGDRDKLLEKIDRNQRKLDSMELSKPQYELERDGKLDSIHTLLADITKNIVRIKDLEEYEKKVLRDASDDDNLVYFNNYIKHYRTKQETGRDTIH